MLDIQERKCRQLNETLEKKEKDLEELDSEVTIEKRQIWRIGSEIQSKRAKLNRMKKDLRKKVSRYSTKFWGQFYETSGWSKNSYNIPALYFRKKLLVVYLTSVWLNAC